jgi:hypothetical protein
MRSVAPRRSAPTGRRYPEFFSMTQVLGQSLQDFTDPPKALSTTTVSPVSSVIPLA